MRHGPTCICTRCNGARRKARREAERPKRLPAENVSSVLLQARAAGFTYREISEQTGIGLATVYRLCRGDTQCNPRTQQLLEGLELVEAAKTGRG
jgi:DNA invertase Pin-like site-specific DNA recombinase